MADFQLPPLSEHLAFMSGTDAAERNLPRVPAGDPNWANLVKFYCERYPNELGVSIPISTAWLRGYDAANYERNPEIFN